MRSFEVVLVFAVLTGSQAFLFWGGSRQAAEGDIDSECEAKAREGNCEFYTCFDVRHPCSRHNWALSYGWRYCKRFEHELSRFTQEAQHWINGTQTCTKMAMLAYYRREHIVCEDLEEDMKDTHAKCEESYGVCNSEMLMDNKEVLMDIYKISRRGLFRFLMFVRQCGGSGVSTFLDWAKGQIQLIDPFFDRLKRLFD